MSGMLRSRTISHDAERQPFDRFESGCGLDEFDGGGSAAERGSDHAANRRGVVDDQDLSHHVSPADLHRGKLRL